MESYLTNDEILELLKKDIIGDKYTVRHSEEALDTLMEALSHVPKAKRFNYLRFIYITMTAVANGERLSKGTLVAEEEVTNGKRYYALKKIPIRGYFFYCSGEKNPNDSLAYICFYIFKNYQSLGKNITPRVKSHFNRKAYEG